VAKQAVEIAGATALEEWSIRSDLASTPIVTGVGDAEAVSWGLTLRPSEGWGTQAAWA